jgi:hypothetical protein
MREFNPRGNRRTTFPMLSLALAFGPLLACATSFLLTACASNAPHAQFLPLNLSSTTSGVEYCDPWCSQKTAQTEAVPGATVPWKSSVVVPNLPYEYQPYQGEHNQPTDTQPQM